MVDGGGMGRGEGVDGVMDMYSVEKRKSVAIKHARREVVTARINVAINGGARGTPHAYIKHALRAFHTTAPSTLHATHAYCTHA